MDVRALLFGSLIRKALTVVLGLGIVVGGAFVGGFIGVPSVESIDNQFGGVNETETAIETDLVVNNPNPIGIRLGSLSVDYAVSMNGVEMATGQKDGVGIGTGNSTINLTTYLQNERIPEWWVTHINNGETTQMTVSATAKSGLIGQSASFQPASETIKTNILGQFNSSEDRPIDANFALVEDPVMIIEETSANWGEATASRTPIDMRFDVHNPKNAPIAISNIGYNITMNDVQVGEGETAETETIPPQTTETVSFSTDIKNQHLDEWWVSHIENGQVTDLRIDFYAEIQPPGSDETIRVPLDDMTYSQTIETDFFGNKG
jgi:LEA14-like dessication related protein